MLPELIIPLGIFIMSIFWWPKAIVPFEVPKVEFFELFVKVLGIFFVLLFLKTKKEWKLDKNIAISIIIFLVWSIFTSLIGVDSQKSFFGNFYRDDGIITLIHLVGFSFLISYFWKENYRKKIALAFFSSSFLLSVFTIYEIVINQFGIGSAATFGNPNFLAGFIAASLPFTVYLYKEKPNKVYLFGTFVIVLAILLIGAVSSILTLILLIIIYLIKFNSAKIKKPVVILLSIVFILIFGIWAKNYYLENSRVFIQEGRVRIFRNVFIGFTKRPITGYGWANVDYAFKSNNWPLKINNDIYVDKAHSEILEILATTGVVGFTVYLFLIFFVFRKLLQKNKLNKDTLWNFTLLSLFILYIFHAQSNIISIAEQIIFWFIVGITVIKD